jgi:hypothetical protein
MMDRRNTMSKYRILLSLLLALSLGCGLLGGIDSGEESENGGGGGGDGGDGVEIEDLTGLDSYRARTQWMWSPDGGEAETYTMTEERIRDPQAARVVIEIDGEQGSEFVQIGDQSWTCFGGVCSQTDMDAEDAVSGFGMSMSQWGFSEDDLDYKGRETVNGVGTRHYAVELTLAEVVGLAQGNVSDFEVETWLADESGLPSFIVKHECSWREERGEETGDFEWSYEVYDVNASFTIEPPEGAAAWPEDVPRYPGAVNSTLMEGMISFYADDPADSVAGFYAEALAGEGWTMEDETDMGAALMQTWTKAGRTLDLTITEQGDMTQVVIRTT